jgi:CelD/BcsL family acetyltransferase involved in cellulose biosynthesis
MTCASLLVRRHILEKGLLRKVDRTRICSRNGHEGKGPWHPPARPNSGPLLKGPTGPTPLSYQCLRTRATNGLSVELVRDVRALEQIRDTWNALLEGNETKTVELSYEWQMTYWQHYHENAELFVLVVREDGSIRGIAPLKRTFSRPCGVTIRSLEFIAASESNYQDFIMAHERKEIISAIWTFLTENRDLWDVLRLAHVPARSSTGSFIQSDGNRPFRHRLDRLYPCLYVEVVKPWREYFQGLSSNVRHKIARCTRVLERMGPVHFYRCTTAESFREHLEILFELHRRRWNQTDTPSQFTNPRACQFYLDTVSELFPKGQIELWVLSVGDKPIVLTYAFAHDHALLTQLVAFDQEYEKGSPVAVSDYFMMKDAFNNGIRVVDLGDYFEYKTKWLPDTKQKLTIEIYSPRFLPAILCTLATVKAPIRTTARRIPGLARMIRRIRRGGETVIST